MRRVHKWVVPLLYVAENNPQKTKSFKNTKTNPKAHAHRICRRPAAVRATARQTPTGQGRASAAPWAAIYRDFSTFTAQSVHTYPRRKQTKGDDKGEMRC
eukprot:2140028-Prymnesium_polylepis.1